MAEETQTVTIDGTQYRYADLSEEARRQAHNISVVDQEITRLKNLQAMQQTARNAYATALEAALPKKTH